VIAIVRKCGSLEYTRQLAIQEADSAISILNDLPDTVFRKALQDMANLAVMRTS